jgi:hypothetical protein
MRIIRWLVGDRFILINHKYYVQDIRVTWCVKISTPQSVWDFGEDLCYGVPMNLHAIPHYSPAFDVTNLVKTHIISSTYSVGSEEMKNLSADECSKCCKLQEEPAT